MLEALNNLIESIFNGFDMIYTFFSTGIYDLAVWALARIIEKLTIGYFTFMLWALPFAFDTAKQIMIDLQLSVYINAAWASLDSQVLALANLMKIPESVNIIVSAYFTKFVLRFIPFI